MNDTYDPEWIHKSDIQLFEAAASTCRGEWNPSEPDRADLDALAFPEDECGKNEVLKWIREVRRIRREEPGVKVTFVTSASLAPCAISAPPEVHPATANYQALADADCQRLLDHPPSSQDNLPLYRAAALACLGRWTEAEDAFDLVGVPQTCDEKVAFTWLETLVKASRATSGFTNPRPDPPLELPEGASGALIQCSTGTDP